MQAKLSLESLNYQIVSFASSGDLVTGEHVFVLNNLMTHPQTLPNRLAIIFGCSESLALDNS